MNLAPTVLLLVAVIKVRCMVSKLRSKAILQKERLILIHTILFSLTTIFYALSSVALKTENSAQSYSAYCKSFIVQTGFYMCLDVTNTAIFMLIAYMSVRFSKPLEGQW